MLRYSYLAPVVTALEKLSKEELIERYIELEGHFERNQAEVEKLRHELEQLKRMIFASKSERFVPSQPDEQLTLGLDTQEITPAVTTQQVTYLREKTMRKEKPVRQSLPAHLPRTEIIIEPEGDLTGMKKIGEEVTEELEYQPGKLFVNRYVRPKYVRGHEDGVLIGSLPVRPIEKGIAGPGLLAQIAIDKFVDHLPVYRQTKRYEREGGMKIAPSTMGGWLPYTCQLLNPLYRALRKEVLSSGYIQAIKVLEKKSKNKGAHKGYQWVYHAPVQRLVLFEYQEGREGHYPKKMLSNFQGYLQTDGFSGYEWFDTQPGIELIHCMAHARRYFDKAKDNDRARSEQALTLFGQLYQVESQVRQSGMSEEKRLEHRQKNALPVLKEIDQWMEKHSAQVLPESPVGKAIAYTRRRWDKLCRYAYDGMVEIDNNLVENTIRPLALGRKNYLFAGSHEAAQRIAMFYSFFGTCARNEVEPYKWLRKVLSVISDYPINKIQELLPTNSTFFSQEQN